MTREKLLYPPTVWSYNWDDRPDGTRDPRHGVEGRQIPYDCYLECVGKTLPLTRVALAGAPGTGRVVSVVTRVDETGAYGYVEEDTTRELEPWEVE